MQANKVSVRLGTTVNIGDFQSIRIDIEVEDFVRDVDEGKTAKAIDRVYDLVDAKLTEKAKEYK